MIFYFFLIILSNSILDVESRSYKGFKVISVTNGINLDFLSKFEQSKFVDDFRCIESNVFLVSPSLVELLKKELETGNIRYQIRNIDWQCHLSDTHIERKRSAENNWFEAYHPYEEMLDWLDRQASKCGGRFCSLIDIGKSYEGRPMRVIKLTGNNSTCLTKQSIWIDAGIHSREWITHTTAMYLIDKLITEYETDLEVRRLRNDYDWYVLTTVNPDGYNYTWTTDRLWRKSRQFIEGNECIGTDINRNFDYQWMTIGASDNPCSENFAGPAPFSEPESVNVARFVHQLPDKVLFVTLHSYGQLFMSPWGYTKEVPSNYESLTRVGQAAVNSMYNVHQTLYKYGSAANILYESSGTSRDWAAGVAGVPFVYTIELRNTESFCLPPSSIIPTGEEIWAGIKAAVKNIGAEIPPCRK